MTVDVEDILPDVAAVSLQIWVSRQQATKIPHYASPALEKVRGKTPSLQRSTLIQHQETHIALKAMWPLSELGGCSYGSCS